MGCGGMIGEILGDSTLSLIGKHLFTCAGLDCDSVTCSGPISVKMSVIISDTEAAVRLGQMDSLQETFKYHWR